MVIFDTNFLVKFVPFDEKLPRTAQVERSFESRQRYYCKLSELLGRQLKKAGITIFIDKDIPRRNGQIASHQRGKVVCADQDCCGYI